MKKLIFTIAFGNSKYKRMAEVLGKSIKKYNSDVEFKIFDEDDFTPYEIGLPKDRKLYPKDYKYPKIEIMSKLNDPDTQYMFIDADAFIVGRIDKYFEYIEENSLIIEYRYNNNGTWAGREDLKFSNSCKDIGYSGIKPYSLNSGFMMWQGGLNCFEKALDLIKSVTINDLKGRNGDEYYYCLAIQLTNTKIIPLNYKRIKLGKYWGGNFKFKDGKLISSRYPENDRIIIHYGNENYMNPYIQFTIKNIERNFYCFDINMLTNVKLKVLNICFKCKILINRIIKKLGL